MFLLGCLILSFIGALSAYGWFKLITKTADYLEYGKCCLRDLENRLANLSAGIGLDYYKGESQVFYDKVTVTFEHSAEQFPHEEDHRAGKHIFRHKVKGGLIDIEKRIAFFIVVFWSICFLASFLWWLIMS